MLFAFVSCEKDEYWKTGQPPGYSQEKEDVISTMDFEEFSQQRGAEKIIHKLEQMQKPTSKGLLRGNSEGGFNIDSTRINQVRLDGKTSYTFLIYRDTLSTEYFENLMISTDNETEEQHTFIYRYYNENHPEFPGVIRETFDPLGQDETSNRYSYLDCEWIEELITVEIPCSCAGHYPGEECSCGDDEGETAPYSEFRLVMKYECKRMGSSEGPNWYDWTDGPINPHGPGGGVDMPDVYTSTVSSYLIDLLNCLTLDPGSNEVKWLLGNFLEMRKLSTFLTDNGCSEDAREFAALVIEAWMNDGEVDFEERIIYDSTLNDFPCHRDLIIEVNYLCTPMSIAIMNAFNSYDGTNLIYKVSNSITENAVTSTTSTYNPNTHSCNITITFRESFLQTATDLAIADLALHEGLHAILVFLLEAGELSSNGSDYADLIEAYINYIGDLPHNLGESHHQLMTNFVDDLASALSIYGSNQGYSISFNDYKNLVWGELMQTPTFQSLYPQYLGNGNVNPAWLEINNSFVAEQNNSTITYNHQNGNTYVFNPKGTPPNSAEPCD